MEQEQETAPGRAINPNVSLDAPMTTQSFIILKTWTQVSYARNFNELRQMLKEWEKAEMPTRKLFEQAGQYILLWAGCMLRVVIICSLYTRRLTKTYYETF